jgi:hypothetical protein
MTEWTQGLAAGLPGGRLIAPDPGFAAGEPVTRPVLWVSDDPVPDAGRWWARLVSQHRVSGLWPLLLIAVPDLGAALMGGDTHTSAGWPSRPARPWQTGELAPVPPDLVDGIDPDMVLARGWDEATGGGFGFDDAMPGLPYRRWPGMAGPAAMSGDPDQHAAEVAAALNGTAGLTGSAEEPYLGLVPAVDGAAAIAACGWLSPAGETAGTAAVIRSWQDRFGARLLSLGTGTLAVSVAWPPSTLEHARRVAAEHLAFCNDLANLIDFGDYAQSLVDAGAWTLWWD